MSPFYPTDYPQLTTCRWTIALPQGYEITLHFEDVDIEPSPSCDKDWLSLRLRNGTTLKYCNKSHHDDLYTKSNVIVLEFHSDQVSTLNKGFRLRYTSVYYNPDLAVTTIGPTPEQTNTTTLNATTETVPTTPNAQITEDITEYVTKRPTEILNSTQANPSVVVGETHQPQSYDAWTVIVAVCLIVVILAIVLVAVYFKCLRKRFNLPEKQGSTVKYCKEEEGAYVDIDCRSNSIFGEKASPGIPVYDNYPSDSETGNATQTVKNEATNPIYEKIEENKDVSEEKCQNNVLYSGSEQNSVNVYEELSNPRKKQNNLYESASLPPDSKR
ncbi:Cubilin [Exaiptasia diaphana]|nr:Cubilin [Exaiptasia diaphana]